jgi:hypothetical protein
MIPNFNDDRVYFVNFIKNNKDIFYTLLISEEYYITQNFNIKYIKEAYYFFINVSLTDDANLASLIYYLDDFNNYENETDINIIINEFEKWLHTEKTKKYFKIELNKKMEKELIEKINKFENIKDKIIK